MTELALAWFEMLFPNTKVYIDFALKYVPAEKIDEIIKQALSDWKLGMSFSDILKDLLSRQLPIGVTMPE